ncbi:MAG: hypothetical protein PQJ60_11420 [Spirochaetales bacterium]|nr:hypothetical protein [Spirochaetales bacterium]
MRKKLFTLLIILAVAAFIYYNKGSFIERYRTRKDVEHRIENLTGTDVDLRNFFKGIEGINRDWENLEEESLQELKERLEGLSPEELESLRTLWEEKGDQVETFLNDVLEDGDS